MLGWRSARPPASPRTAPPGRRRSCSPDDRGGAEGGASSRSGDLGAEQPVPTTGRGRRAGGSGALVRRGEAWSSTAHVYHCAAHLQEPFLHARARVERGLECRSAPERLGVFVAGGASVPSVSVPTVRTGPVSTSRLPIRQTGSCRSTGSSGTGATAKRRQDPALRARRSSRLPLTVVSDTWWSPNATCMSTVCRGVLAAGRCHVVRAVRLAAVPEQLDLPQP
jgi:hypothetical protein